MLEIKVKNYNVNHTIWKWKSGKEGGGGVKKGERGEGKADRGGKKNKTEKGLC